MVRSLFLSLSPASIDFSARPAAVELVGAVPLAEFKHDEDILILALVELHEDAHKDSGEKKRPSLSWASYMSLFPGRSNYDLPSRIASIKSVLKKPSKDSELVKAIEDGRAAAKEKILQAFPHLKVVEKEPNPTDEQEESTTEAEAMHKNVENAAEEQQQQLPVVVDKDLGLPTPPPSFQFGQKDPPPPTQLPQAEKVAAAPQPIANNLPLPASPVDLPVAKAQAAPVAKSTVSINYYEARRFISTINGFTIIGKSSNYPTFVEAIIPPLPLFRQPLALTAPTDVAMPPPSSTPRRMVFTATQTSLLPPPFSFNPASIAQNAIYADEALTGASATIKRKDKKRARPHSSIWDEGFRLLKKARMALAKEDSEGEQ